ncbi:MAG: heavy-metal-associated domain-containing protein [Bacteroidota bacterium]
MPSLQFKTNVKCNGCKAAITPFLDNEETISEWRVDIFDPDRILTVEGEDVKASTVIAILEKAGYKAELID